MQTRYFVLVFGSVYALVGLLGFLPGLTQAPSADAPRLSFDLAYGYLLGLFPINLLHNLVHLAVGIGGILAYQTFSAARGYARILAAAFGLLTIMGLIPELNTTFGLIPLFGHDVWLHALTALISAYFGFLAPRAARRTAGSSSAYDRIGAVGDRS